MTSAVHEATTRHSRAEYNKLQAAERESARAEEDYERLRSAYFQIARNVHGNEVALAMIGADMDRARASLQSLSGLWQLPFTYQPTTVLRRDVRRMAEENS